MRASALPLALSSLLFACAAPASPERTPPDDAVSEGDEIVICGERFSTGAPVVLWFEAPHYDAYATHPRFSDDGPIGLRYHPGRKTDDAELAARTERHGWTLGDLRRVVDLFVVHYDVCGTSRGCFRVLQDMRQLSVHFLLDVDGTIYQTLDLEEQAWHARQANPRSIGVEIAHIGAYREDAAHPLDEWYAADERGARLTIPARLGTGGVRAPDFDARVRGPIRGEVRGDTLVQYDFTDAQYDSLAKLAATLAEALPGIALDAPRDADGRVRTDGLSDEEFEAYRGVLGHWHVSESKRDPGPAFDWERFLGAARAHLTERALGSVGVSE